MQSKVSPQTPRPTTLAFRLSGKLRDSTATPSTPPNTVRPNTEPWQLRHVQAIAP